MADLAPRGGADLMLEGLKRHVNIPDDLNIVNSVCQESVLDPDKRNLVWQHIPADQPLVMGMRDKFFVRSVDQFVYVSHWQHEKYRYLHQIPLRNSTVIRNAIEPIEFLPRDRDDKIRIIYTSMPYRGLEILLDVIELINADDVEVDVYSSSLIYGSEYARTEGAQHQFILDRAAATKDVTLHDYTPNEGIRLALQRAHIFAYPCIFEETACLSMIEAGAAGCRMVTTNIGGLPETGSHLASLVPMQASREDLVGVYASALQEAIAECRAGFRGDEIQSSFYNEHYAWERRAQEWRRLFEAMS